MTHLITRARAHLCADLSPPGYAGHWRDWHRGHDCELDPGAPNGARAIIRDLLAEVERLTAAQAEATARAEAAEADSAAWRAMFKENPSALWARLQAAEAEVARLTAPCEDEAAALDHWRAHWHRIADDRAAEITRLRALLGEACDVLAAVWVQMPPTDEKVNFAARIAPIRAAMEKP